MKNRPLVAAAVAAAVLLLLVVVAHPLVRPSHEAAPRPAPVQATDAATGAPASAPVATARPAAPPEPPEPAAEPPSDDVVAGWLRVAEAAFEDGDLAVAGESYRRIVEEAPDARVAPYALYKLGWCEYNAGRPDEAVRAMEMLVDWAEAGNVPGADVLAKQAEQDLADFRRKGSR